jgi:hypothetical protein
MNDSQKALEIERITFENLKVRLLSRIGPYTLDSLRVGVISNILAEGLVAELDMKILGQKNSHEYEVSFQMPKNWWQHLRQTVLPGFWLKKCPVKKKIIKKYFKFDHYSLLPKWERRINQNVVMYSQPSEYNRDLKKIN